MYIQLQDDQPIPWSSMTEKDCMGNTLHCTKNCTRSLQEEVDIIYKMIQRITLLTVRKQLEQEKPSLMGHQKLSKWT